MSRTSASVKGSEFASFPICVREEAPPASVSYLPMELSTVAVFRPRPKGALERPRAYGAGNMGTYTPFHLRRA